MTRWKTLPRLALVVVAACLLCCSSVNAKKPDNPGGGGETPPPAGTIYFRHEGTIWQMDGAGTPASRVPLATTRDDGDPSYARHEGERWFAYDFFHPLDDPPFPSGQQFRDIRAGSETGQEVVLLADPDIEPVSRSRWATDDASITFIGQRWQLDPKGLPIAVDAGLYELYVDFSSGTPVAGALDFVADLSGPMRAGPDGFPLYPDAELAGHSWNEDGTQLAFGIRIKSDTLDADEIWVADLLSGTFSLLDVGGAVGWPQWSPDGKRIGYYSRNGTVVYDLSTGRKKVLKGTPSTSWEEPFWSPTGEHFVIGHWDRYLIGEDAIYRFTATLRDKTELTAGLNDPVPYFNVLIPLGWRN